MSFEDLLALANKEIELLETEEEENLSQYISEHLEEFPAIEKSSYEQRTGFPLQGLTTFQKKRLARKNKRYRERKKEVLELERRFLGLQQKDWDLRIKTIKVYKIRIPADKNN